MQSNCENMKQHHSSFPDLQYYEIDQSDASISDSVQCSRSNIVSSRQKSSTTAAHLYPISLCANSGTLSQQHQLQNIIPGSVFDDPTLGHLHYHIYPSQQTITYSESERQSQGKSGCQNHVRFTDQLQQHKHHQHYQKNVQPKTLMRQPPLLPLSSTTLDGFIKENERTNSSNLDNFDRYTHMTLGRSEKCKNVSLMELNNKTQLVITGLKGKCQCHAMQQQDQQQLLRQKHDLGGRNISAIEEEVLTPSQHYQQPPALPPRPPRPSSRRYELPSNTSTNQRGPPVVEPVTGPYDAFAMAPHLQVQPYTHFTTHHHTVAASTVNHANFLQHVRPTASYSHTCGHAGIERVGGCCKKYVVLCCLCGGLSVAVGSLFLAVHAVLSAHTASLALFETVPSYIPGAMLIFMGLFTMFLARRKHRYSFLMKVCGSVSIVCALVCVLITVTTTVVHMSRLQGLRECVYTARAKSCTCYGAPQSLSSDPGVLFEGTPDCEAVHGALYACLRALFGVSVAGILACIFSCMLVYQLLNHEKKKMYWEQLELRCRSLYGHNSRPGLISASRTGTCGCCNDCGGIGPWWAQTPGNLYTPNPDLAPSRRWRLPWSRSRGPAPSADANYGFHSQTGADNGESLGTHHQAEGMMDAAGMLPYSILGPQSTGAYSVLPTTGHEDPYTQNNVMGPYSVLETAVPLWGPPPPYSDPNSPARTTVLTFPPTDPRMRLSKIIDNFPVREEYNRSPDIKRSNSNYENSEQVLNNTHAETGRNSEGRVIRINKRKKLLKGVENAAFQQQESNAVPKQSESELYFGDVSSCCGAESSLYDIATEKEGKRENSQSDTGTSYLSSRFSKHLTSKNAHHDQQTIPQQHDSEMVDLPSNSSCSSNSDEASSNRSASYSIQGPDIEYELIKKRHYSYDSQNVSTVSVHSERQIQQQQQLMEVMSETKHESDDGAYGADKETEKTLDRDRKLKDYRTNFEGDVRPVNV